MMEDAGIFDNYQNIHLITDSLGGVLTKRMTLLVRDRSVEQLARIKSVFLLSVPSKGAKMANFLEPLFTILGGQLVQDLRTLDKNAYLRSVENDWQQFLRKRKAGKIKTPRIFCAYETQPIFSKITPVPEIYTSTTCDETPFPENANHLDIVKPKSRSDSIYKWIRGRLIDTSKKIGQCRISSAAIGTSDDFCKEFKGKMEVFRQGDKKLLAATYSIRKYATHFMAFVISQLLPKEKNTKNV